MRNSGASSTIRKPQLAFKFRTPINDEVSEIYYTMHEWGLEREMMEKQNRSSTFKLR